MASERSDRLEIRVLGSLEVMGPRAPLRLGGRKERALLALLVLRAGEYVPFATLLEEIWADEALETDVAAVALRSLLTRVRRALDETGAEPILQTRRGVGYRLHVEADQIDVLRFERLVRRGRRASGEGTHEVVADLEEALALWRAAPLAEFVDFAFARTEAARLEGLRLDATEQLAEALLSLGRPADALPLVEGLVEAHPYRERAWALLMASLYRLGRQADALRAFQQLREALREGLGIEPSPALRELERQVLLQSGQLEGLAPSWSDLAPGPSSPVAGRKRHNLPTRLSPFGGREHELAEVSALVGGSRLVTLVGIGGVGKTRLAIEVATRLLDRYPDGVWFAELAPLADADLIGHQLLAGLGPRGDALAPPGESADDRLCRHLESRHLLLVVDNCEHLMEPVAHVVDRLLEQCPGVSILATSREPLDIRGEAVWRVPPLSLPPQGARQPVQLRGSDAVALFCEWARAADPAFELGPDNAAVVGEVCRRLDGIPLALELAAARLRLLSLEQVAQRLDERFRLLARGSRSAVGRHRTLKAAMDWSYQLLSPLERLALRRLSVFPASFDLEAAEQVLEELPSLPRHEVLEVLGSLSDKSLLLVESGVPDKRYRLLETVREYAEEHLAEADETEMARRRHGELFLGLVRRYWMTDPHADTGRWLRRFDVENDNLRAALEWSLAAGEADTCLEIAGALRIFWLSAGRFSEGCHWYERALAHPVGRMTPARISALNGFGLLVGSLRGGHELTRQLHTEALDAALAIGDHLGEAVARGYLGHLAFQDGDLDEARDLLLRARQAFLDGGWATTAAWCEFHLGWVALEHDDRRSAEQAFTSLLAAARANHSDDLVAHALGALGPLAALRGEDGRARRWVAEAVDLARALALDEILVMALVRAGEVAVLVERFDEAEVSLREALGLLRRIDGRAWVADCFELLALVAEQRGQGRRAVGLLGACQALRIALRERVSHSRWSLGEAQRCRARLAGALGEAALEQEWARGTRMTIDEALSLALDETLAFRPEAVAAPDEREAIAFPSI